MGKNKQKIDYRSIKYISDNKLEQMYDSYKDWAKKNNYHLGTMNMYYPLKNKIQCVIDEMLRRLGQNWKWEKDNGK